LPVDVEILKLLEDNGSSEPKLDKHFDIYDVCGKERGSTLPLIKFEMDIRRVLIFLIKALDACETTAKVFKCGVEKDPQGMADLIVGSAAKAEEDANVSLFYVAMQFFTNAPFRQQMWLGVWTQLVAVSPAYQTYFLFQIIKSRLIK
jgi:hypothetical protein